MPLASAISLTNIFLRHFSTLYKAAVSAVVGDFAAPHLLHHLRPELGAGHTPQLALGQHVEDGLRGILLGLGGADAALLHEVGVLLVGAAVKDGHGCLHALHLRLLDVEQGCPGRGGVAAFLVAEVELFAVLVAAHHEDAAGDVPDVGAVGQTGTARDVSALVGVHRDEGRAAVPGAEGFEGQQGPWTDIYAFSAVLYRTLIGSTPLEATSRVTNDRLMVPGKFAEQLPAYVINALMNGLQILPEDRTRTVDQLRAELSAAPGTSTAAIAYAGKEDAPYQEPVPSGRKKSASGSKTALIAGLASIAACLVIFAVLSLTVWREDIGMFFTGGASTQASSNAPELVKVPDFRGLNYNNIKSNTDYTNAFFFETEYQDSDTQGKDVVLSQNIAYGTEVPKGSTIKLVLSSGNEEITLPDFKGQNYATVKLKLEEMGFQCRAIVEKNDDSERAGKVAEMLTTPEKGYKKGTVIYVKVWGEVETKEASQIVITVVPEESTGT